MSVVVTVALLQVTRFLTANRPVDYVVREAGMTLTHRAPAKQIGPGQPLIRVEVDPAQSLGMAVRWLAPPATEIGARGLPRIDEHAYAAALPAFEKGTRVRYWITATTPEETTVRLPKDPSKFCVLIFEGRASKSVLVAHVVFMFGAFFFMVMSFFGGIAMLRGREGKRGTVRAARWVLVSSFIGFVPLGMILNYQTFGMLWEGYPFGRDITDNKTQLIFVFWLLSLLLVRGSFVGGGEERDRVGPRPFAWAIIGSFLVSLALFIVPHSI